MPILPGVREGWEPHQDSKTDGFLLGKICTAVFVQPDLREREKNEFSNESQHT
jgi:hypothetical protein